MGVLLPDDVLLEIFDLYMLMMKQSRRLDKREIIEAWQPLVHVCRRWRNIVFESPRRLNLQLVCTPKSRKDTLDVWPALPLIVMGTLDVSSRTDNIIAALGQNDRVRQIDLYLQSWTLESVLAPMQVSFPELTDLHLFQVSYDDETLVIPDSFLGGSAPRLRSFTLTCIPFPGLPKILLTTTHLVQLHLRHIPHSGYISPKAMAALLSVLSSLESLHLDFPSPQSQTNWESQSLPLPERSILPALREFGFKGFTGYLEELVTRIDTPRLDNMCMTFFNQIDFDCPRLAQFINRAPKLKKRDAQVEFDDNSARVRLPALHSTFGIDIFSFEPGWQLSSIAQVCNSSLPPISMVEELYIEHRYLELVWENNAIEKTAWLELLFPFTAVQDLYISKELAPGIAAVLEELAVGRIKEVLPSLQNMFVEGLEPSRYLQENIGQFVAARQLSNHPITVSVWDKDPKMKSM